MNLNLRRAARVLLIRPRAAGVIKVKRGPITNVSGAKKEVNCHNSVTRERIFAVNKKGGGEEMNETTRGVFRRGISMKAVSVAK